MYNKDLLTKASKLLSHVCPAVLSFDGYAANGISTPEALRLRGCFLTGGGRGLLTYTPLHISQNNSDTAAIRRPFFDPKPALTAVVAHLQCSLQCLIHVVILEISQAATED